MTYTGKAFVYYGQGDVRLEERTVECGAEEMIVRVTQCARCGSEKTVYARGHKSVDPYAPTILGHEFVAEIVEVGDRVRTLEEGIGFREGVTLPEEYLEFKAGERVVFQSRIARYRNGLMLIPDPIANIAFQIDGGYAEYMKVTPEVIRSESVLRVPQNVNDETACLAEPAACALESVFSTPHAVGVDEDGRHVYRAGILPGGHVCIIGSGTVGMIYALLARIEGAERVLMVVRSEEKRELVSRLLGDAVEIYVAPRTQDDASDETLGAEDAMIYELTELTEGKLFDDVICACASTSAQRLMFRLYAPEGYAAGACFGGTHELVDRADVDQNHYRAACTFGTSGCSTWCMNTVLQWMAEGKLDFTGFTSRRRFTLDDDPHEFFTTPADGLKPVLYPGG